MINILWKSVGQVHQRAAAVAVRDLVLVAGVTDAGLFVDCRRFVKAHRLAKFLATPHRATINPADRDELADVTALGDGVSDRGLVCKPSGDGSIDDQPVRIFGQTCGAKTPLPLMVPSVLTAQ